MPSPDTLVVALLLLAILIVLVAILLLLLRNIPSVSSGPTQPPTIPAHGGYQPVGPRMDPVRVFAPGQLASGVQQQQQQQQRRAAPKTQRLTESDWYGSVGGSAPWGGERDDAQWPQAR